MSSTYLSSVLSSNSTIPDFQSETPLHISAHRLFTDDEESSGSISEPGDEEMSEESLDANLGDNSENESIKIKVFLRVRPAEDVCAKYQFNRNRLLVENGAQEAEIFEFSKILNQSSQWEVVEECALPLLKELVRGHNSLLSTYGVTSSGKSYTMRGTHSEPGIIPTSLILLFDSLSHVIRKEQVPEYKPHQFSGSEHLRSEEEKLAERENHEAIIQSSGKSHFLDIAHFKRNQSTILPRQGSAVRQIRQAFEQSHSTGHSCDVGVWISYFEIYNDLVFDLLESSGDKLKILKDSSGNNFVKGVRQVFVTSVSEAYKVLMFGENNLRRHISATSLNRTSSRSHSVFRISLVRVDYTAETALTSNICFCDLAGTERSKKTNNTGDRLAESSKINQSLMQLSRCIRNWKQHTNGHKSAAHFRDSKLTQVLQPYLSGTGGRTHIITNLNPSSLLFDESNFAFRFCVTANQIYNPASVRSVRRLTVKLSENEQKTKDSATCTDLRSLSELMEAFEEQKEREMATLRNRFLDELYRRKKVAEVEMERKEVEIEDMKEIHNQRMEINNRIFQEFIDELKEKNEKLENEIFATRTELIETKTDLENKNIELLAELAQRDERIKCLEEILGEKNNPSAVPLSESPAVPARRTRKRGRPANQECASDKNVSEFLPSELLDSIRKPKRRKSSLNAASDFSVFSARKQAPISQQMSTRKRVPKRRSSTAMISPESIIQAEPRPRRNRKKLF